MENAQKELLYALLDRLLALGLISEPVFRGTRDLVYAARDLPNFFRQDAALEEAEHERPSDPL